MWLVKLVKLLLVVTFAGAAILTGALFYFGSRNEARALCAVVYHDFGAELDAASNSTGLEKLAHLKAVQMNLELLLHKGCCNHDYLANTCPASVTL